MYKSHGMTHTAEYQAWADIKKRCLNKNHKSYHHYGGRQITICERWSISFFDFLKDVGNRPSNLYSIDRMDNDGNYESGNVRWTTRDKQNYNRRKTDRNTSGYIGVAWNKGKWSPFISVKYTQYNLGRFVDPEQAAIEYDKAVIFFRGYDGITNIIPNKR